MKIELSNWEINVILKALAEQPYNRVSYIIHSLKGQSEVVS